MSRRLNMYGFSLGRMRRLCGSHDEEALRLLRDEVTTSFHYLEAERRTSIMEVVEQAVTSGLPFGNLQTETSIHSVAAGLLAHYDQEWLITEASHYHASALEEGLWRGYGKLASPETRAFLPGLVEGVPMFGRQPLSDGSAYGAISFERLRAIQPGIRDLVELIAYRVGRKRKANEEEQAAAKFADEFSNWVDQIVKAERDLFFGFG